ncbi:MAG: flagellar export chaperone FliS [Catonella sp.]|uniref:flagellar export chaperone FliS n=1 Tax=Catonella sp. TaxID=2382125 RepID=UPI003F9F3296
MKAESIKIYTRRVTSANKSELIVIIYDIIEENLTLAEEALANGDKESFSNELKQAVSFVKELLVSLDMNYEVSKNLASLYIYVSRCLNFALVSGKKEEIEAARKVIIKLGDSFREVAKSDNSKPVMENTQQVYAGMTYGKGLSLDETLLDAESMDRGFRA